MVEESSILILAIEDLCQGKTFGAIMAALMGMMSKVLYHVSVDARERFLVDLEKKIRECIERVPELEEALEEDGKQSDS